MFKCCVFILELFTAGNCQFRALSDQVCGTPDKHEVRFGCNNTAEHQLAKQMSIYIN